MLAIYGVVLYDFWKSRNGKIFWGQAANIGFLVQKVQVVMERINMYIGTKLLESVLVTLIGFVCSWFRGLG